MSKVKVDKNVVIRIKMGQYELEVRGPKTWADKMIEEFIERRRKEALNER